VLVADIEHGEGLINTDDPAALQALRHRPGHSTGTRRQIENLFVALQNEHFSQFLGQISANSGGSAIKLCRVLRIMEMSLVPVAMAVFVIGSMVMPVNMFVIVRVLMPMFVVVFATVLMFVIMLVALMVLAMLMFVSVFMIVLMVVFVFAHGFAIPSNEIRLIFAHLHRR
jgi:hypothetical protein